MSMLAAFSTSALAEHDADYEKWVGGFFEAYNPDNDRMNQGGSYDYSTGLGAEFGYRFNSHWATRAEWSNIALKSNGPAREEHVNRIGIDAMYFVGEDDFYVFAGAKHLDMQDSGMMGNFGIGKHFGMNSRMKFIAELTKYTGGGYNDTGLKFGLAYTFGSAKATGPRDSDQDGVYDSMDQCPDTAYGVVVDAKGCNIDLDGDGVNNAVDMCPNTPAGTKVDETGCNWDKDGDGVANAVDMCPDTPAGTQVGAKGCSLELDTDQDGVLDTVDQCADTPLTDKVDAVGCSVFMEVEVRETLNVLFANNSDKIQNPNDGKFQEFADFMNRFPNTSTVIEGHASAPGKAEYNMALSLKRARAVRQLLIENYGIDGKRLTAEGFGETRLLDDSNTAEANRINRRIEARVTATKKEKVKKS